MNPYPALVAAGLRGVENRLSLEPRFRGDAYTSDRPRIPRTLCEAMERFESSATMAKAFRDEVVDHNVNVLRAKFAAFDAAVTDRERYRGFERL